MAKANELTVRMYCHGLGDCFLLTFPGRGGKPVRVLIDCGILQRSEGEGPRLQAVAKNLLKDTKGKIDLLVVTHEHWDHVAGFSWAKDVFSKFKFDRVWLSWAENPNDKDAKALKTTLGKKRNGLAKAVAAAKSFNLNSDTVESVGHILGFVGLAPGAANPKKAMTLGECMDWLRDKVQPGDWCHPGERRDLPGAPSVKVYVLGPPKDAKSIRKMNPTGDQGYRHFAKDVSFLAAFDDDSDRLAADPCLPFESRYALDYELAKEDPFFRQNYGFEDDPFGDAGDPSRRIDDDWLLEGLARLGLQLDTGVNNTSLALAFELPDGRTLIFPGDAQIGNWLSWQKLTFKNAAGKKLNLTTKDLLAKAVFYKVGHHGSHNATPKGEGLEQMTSGDLVAMIPVEKSTAKRQKPPKTGWAMPFDKLHNALKAQTDECVLQADEGLKDVDAAAKKVSASPRLKTFRKRLKPAAREKVPGTKRPLYIEYRLPL